MNEKTTGFQDKLMKYMMPVANWVEKNNWLQAIKDGMIADIPVIIIGSIFLLPIALNNLIASGPIHDFISAHMGVLTYAAGFTNDLLSIFAAFFIAVALAKRYGIHNTQTGVTAIIVHLILSAVSIDGGISTEFLGASGLFTSIVSGILSVEITRFLIKRNAIIKLPSSVPPMV